MNVLHIDDNPLDHIVIKATLAECKNIDLRQALTFTDAAGYEPWADVVLLDLYMPDTHGPVQSIATCRALIPNRPILAYTAALLTDEEREEYIGMGVDDVVTKDIKNPRILSRVLSRIHQQRTRQLAEEILADTKQALA